MRIIHRLVLTTLTMSALAACDREAPKKTATPTVNKTPNKTTGGLRLLSKHQGKPGFTVDDGPGYSMIRYTVDGLAPSPSGVYLLKDVSINGGTFILSCDRKVDCLEAGLFNPTMDGSIVFQPTLAMIDGFIDGTPMITFKLLGGDAPDSASGLAPVALAILAARCGEGEPSGLSCVRRAPAFSPSTVASTGTMPTPQAACVDLDLAKVLASQEVTKCNGTKVMGLIINCAENGSACYLPTYAQGSQNKKAVDITNIQAGNIKSGVTIAGTDGVVVAAVAPNAWDVRVGTTINGVTGMLKVNCRNRVNSSLYNHDGSVGPITNDEITNGGSTYYDYWDTIDDYNNGGSGLPPGVVSGWTNNDCGGVETGADDANVWKDITTNGTTPSNCATTADNCTMKDKITGLHWSKIQSTSQTWSQAINTCDALSFNGQTDWRLPTQKELMEAYTHGIRSAATTNWITEGNMINNFWSGSSFSGSTDWAWFVHLAQGYSYYPSKTTSYSQHVVCVR